MNHLDYLDFELEIGQPTGQEYPLTLLRSPAGEARATFTWPFGELALENRLKDLQIALLSSGGVRRTVLTPAEAAVQRFGAELFDLLFTGEVRNRYDVSQERVHHQEKGLRVKLRIQDPRLANLPWEFLYDARCDAYICLSQQTPLVRYLELPQTIRPLAVTPPLRILGMIASPSDLQTLDVQVERQRLERAVAPLQDKGLVQLHWLTGATWRDLQRSLRREAWHIFHFVGHGSFDPQRDEGVIAFCNDTNQAHLLPAGDLGRLLADQRTLRLAVLNACLGAQGSNRDLFSGVAATLVRRGIPAVVAMQQAITDAAAIEFTQTFYESLADGLPVDAAMSEARKAISFALTNTVEWGTPVLYSRASDGHLFQLASLPSTKTGMLENALNAVTNLSGRGDRDLQDKKPSVSPSRKMDDAPALTLGELPSDLDDLVPISAKHLIGYDFHIGKYPVTNYQFHRFIEQQGYIDDRWWRDEDGRRSREQGRWLNPRYWNNTKFNQPAQPVVGISWYEATAYCAWLTAHWRALGKIRRDERVRLPTQEEWIAAARGGYSAPDNRNEDYPWRGPFDPAVANTKESDIRQTTPVHKYPNGRTKNGVWDMSGNVGEWVLDYTSNGYCIKGGGWCDDAKGAMISVVIDWLTRADRSNAYGCRVVVVPNLSLIDFVEIA